MSAPVGTGPRPVASQTSPSTPVVQAPPPGMKLGKTGPAVKALQQSLVRLGYLSEKALNASPGTFDKATWQALAKLSPSTASGRWACTGARRPPR